MCLGYTGQGSAFAMVFGFSGSRATRWGAVRRVLRAPAALLALAIVQGAWGCSTSDAPNAQTAKDARGAKDPRFLPVACGVDQVREFYCDGLLPMSTALGAPEP